MSGNMGGSNGIETSYDYSNMFKNLITKLVDEKTIILEDFIRKNDLSPKEIVLENKEDIRNSTEVITEILQMLLSEIKIFEKESESNSKLLDRSVREAKEKIVDKFNFVIADSVNKELNAVKSVLDAFLIDLRKLDDLKHLENLQNLDILKKLEALESLDKLQDLDKLKDLSYIEKLQELDKLSKLDDIDFKNVELILNTVNNINEHLPLGYENIIEVIKSNREMILDKLILHEDHIQKVIVEAEVRLMEKVCESKFIEVFNKKELPDAVVNKDKKAIVYGGLTGSSLYRSDGHKWTKI